jgi:hypothetical protein
VVRHVHPLDSRDDGCHLSPPLVRQHGITDGLMRLTFRI